MWAIILIILAVILLIAVAVSEPARLERHLKRRQRQIDDMLSEKD